LHEAKGARDERSWTRFVRKFKAEMKASDPARTLDLLAALSHSTELAVGCYCADEARCHRGVLRELLAERGARIDGRYRRLVMDISRARRAWGVEPRSL